MKKIFIILSVILGLQSCSEKALDVDYKDVTTPFVPAADDHSEEAELRRSFNAEHGSYLLFNDTLQHVALGRDVNGNMQYFTELIDITYEIGSSSASNNKYSYTIIPTIERKRQAIEYMEEYILPHLTGKLKPFSWFLADKITRDFIGSLSSPYAVAGQRTIAVATNVLPKLSEAQKVQYTRQIMNSIIGKLASDNASAFKEFTAVSSAYYGGSFSAPATNAENTDILAKAGFICRGQDDFKSEANGLYPSEDLDLQAYARMIAANTRETVLAKYADYPLVLRKYEIAYNVLTSLGYKE